jgi:excisionase family DNA binding protein
MSVTPILLSLRHASEATDLSEMTLRRAINKGELKAVKIGTASRLRPADIEAWISKIESDAQGS